jgi:serine/threonine protein kinase
MSGDTRRRFRPKPGHILSLFEEAYEVQRHPAAPQVAYAAEGARAVVFQLSNSKRQELFALKVFKSKYQDPGLEAIVQRLRPLASLGGMRAAERRVVLPPDPAARDFLDLEYAMLMPWIQGKTWFDVLVDVSKGRVGLQAHGAIAICECFLRVMKGLEQRGVAHTDIAPGNVMVNGPEVQLLDLEDLYLPEVEPPRYQNRGSPGYRHQSVEKGGSLHCQEADRYAAAVLAAEILVLANQVLRRDASDDGFFVGHSRTLIGQERYAKAEPWLRSTAPEFAAVFYRSWYAERLLDCPTLSELHQAISLARQRIPRVEPWLTALQRPSDPSQAEPRTNHVQWVSWGGGLSTKVPQRRPQASPVGTRGRWSFRVPVAFGFALGSAVAAYANDPMWILALGGLGWVVALLWKRSSK